MANIAARQSRKLKTTRGRSGSATATHAAFATLSDAATAAAAAVLSHKVVNGTSLKDRTPNLAKVESRARIASPAPNFLNKNLNDKDVPRGRSCLLGLTAGKPA
jgi:hypothetical protein